MPGSADNLLPIQIVVDGDVVLSRRLGVLASKVKDLRPAWADVHGIFVDAMVRRFASQGSEGGETWDHYSREPRYAAYKRRKLGLARGSRMPVLRWAPYASRRAFPRERLYPSLTDPSHPEHVYRAGKLDVAIGSTTPWGRGLNRGGEVQRWDRVAIPARKIIRFSEGTKRAMVRAILRHLHREAEGGIAEIRAPAIT